MNCSWSKVHVSYSITWIKLRGCLLVSWECRQENILNWSDRNNEMCLTILKAQGSLKSRYLVELAPSRSCEREWVSAISPVFGGLGHSLAWRWHSLSDCSHHLPSYVCLCFPFLEGHSYTGLQPILYFQLLDWLL